MLKTACRLAAVATVCLAGITGRADTTADPLILEVDSATWLTVSGSLGSVFIGNPAIADVAVAGIDIVFVIGRQAGKTNLIILDPDGRPLLERSIRVSDLTTGTLTVRTPTTNTLYACTPRCVEQTVRGSTVQNRSQEELDPDEDAEAAPPAGPPLPNTEREQRPSAF